MIILSQRNPNWAANKLGSSLLTIGRYGCTSTCISMLSDYFNCFKTPAEIAINKDWYTQDGLIIWNKLNFTKMAFVERIYRRDDRTIQAALKDPNRAVILQVNNGQHWVVALRKTLFGNSYIVADPWDGTKCDVLKKYHDITGMAFFSRK